MTIADIAVIIGAVAATAALWRFFFGAKQAHRAELRAGVQELVVTVKGGYSPDRIEVRQGVPVRLVFDRQEAGDCTSRVVFPDFGINRSLPAYTQTPVELVPRQAGEFSFTCGMNMVHGSLVVTGEGDGTQPAGYAVVTAPTVGEGAAGEPPAAPGDANRASTRPADQADEADRWAEIADLSRRVLVGALLTAPVAFAVMAHELFHAGWVPDVLLNRWVQLLLIAPVMAYTGWPIHRSGWLTLRHRTADMNTLIMLGTVAAFGYSVVVTTVHPWQAEARRSPSSTAVPSPARWRLSSGTWQR